MEHVSRGNESARNAPIDLDPDDFREAGHRLIDHIADFIEGIGRQKVTPSETAADVRAAVGPGGVPAEGRPVAELVDEAASLLFDHSLLNGHPRFWGYITSSPAPVGMLGDLLAAAVNPNVGSWSLAPAATEIEMQTIRWLAELVGYPTDCGGILVSGGNMANFVGFLAARRARAPWALRQKGLRAGSGQLRVYVSAKTHTWIEKATDLFGLGTEAIRWIDIDERERMDVSLLGDMIQTDRDRGDIPFMVVATAGTVGTGAIDPIAEIADVCARNDIWLHVDGAYGALAAMLPEAPEDLHALARADSLALDPHKWLYAPLEAGCTLVRRPDDLRDAFSFQPEYYSFGHEGEEEKRNLFAYGMQNSRGFRALKVWMALRQVGRFGYESMIRQDMELSRELFQRIEETSELQAVTNNLSITTFRFVPSERGDGAPENEAYLNRLNRRILDRLQADGEAFVSNAVVRNAFLLRACIVNFRTSIEDVRALPEIVVRTGNAILLEPEEAP